MIFQPLRLETSSQFTSSHFDHFIMSYPEEFQDLQNFIYGSDQPIDGSAEIGSCGGDEMSFFADFVEEQADGQFSQMVDEVQESDGLFVDTLRNINQNGPRDLSSMPTIINTHGGLGLPAYSNDFGFSLNENPYQTVFRFARPRPPPEPMSLSTAFQESSVRQLNPYQSGMQGAEQTPIVASNESYNIHNAQALGNFPAVYTDNSQPKRETSATSRFPIVFFSIIRLLTCLVR
jgi:hypothetical protein